MKNYFLLIILVMPISLYSNVLTISTNSWRRIPNITWNGQLPLAIDANYAEHLEFTARIGTNTIPFTKTRATNFEQDQYVFTPSTPISNINEFQINIKQTNRLLFNSYNIKVQSTNKTPKLNLISISPTINHGGAGVIVIESDLTNDLHFLGLIDEKGVVFYPNIFMKDGFYTMAFSWYSDYSNILSNQYVLAIDKYGNTNTLPINTQAKLRKYVNKTINLPPDYAEQKAKELNLSAEEAKKLEGNITAINSALNVKSVSRWSLTRVTNFQQGINTVIQNAEFFSDPKTPMLKAINTATYGDQRRYLYKNQVVRTSVHRGLDYASVKNAPIYALLDGVVVYADWNSGNGKTVYIDHGMGIYTMYAHNEDMLVKEGQAVKAGEQISISGTTGQSTGDHLHISVIVQGMYVEPKEWLTSQNIQTSFNNPLKKAKEYILTK